MLGLLRREPGRLAPFFGIVVVALIIAGLIVYTVFLVLLLAVAFGELALGI